MPHVLVRDVPEDVHRKLTQQARANGTSLQRYLSSELARLAETPTLDEVIARIEQNSGGRVGLAQAVADLDDIRTERDQVLHDRFEALAAREDRGPRH